MLVLSRKLNQEIVIGDNVTIRILKIKGNTIRLGIEAPRDVKVVRGELPIQDEITISSNAKQADESDGANVTVVFSNEPADSPRRKNLIPFQRHLENNRLDSNRNSSSTNSKEDPTAPPTVRFRQQLPEKLHHNRLKQLVSELTRKN